MKIILKYSGKKKTRKKIKKKYVLVFLKPVQLFTQDIFIMQQIIFVVDKFLDAYMYFYFKKKLIDLPCQLDLVVL